MAHIIFKQIFPVTLFCILVGCGGGDKPLRALSPQGVILAFGDSLTFGTGAKPEESYPAVLQSILSRTVINAGVPGEVTRDGLSRLPRVLDEFKPELVILIHGGNDMIRRQGFAQAEDNIRSMIKLINDAGINVVMLGVPKPSIILSTARFYEEIAQETGTPIDADALSDILQFPTHKSDLIHPNAKGYRLLAEEIRSLLEDGGAI